MLQLQEQARLLTQEKAALKRQAEVAARRAEAADERVLELQQKAREHDASAGQARERIAELQRCLGEREAALQRQTDRSDAAEERARGLAEQLDSLLERAQQDARALDVRPVAQALSGGVCTASHAELAAATRGFAAGSILGRGGFGPVYRGDLGGQAVAIKRLDQARPPRAGPRSAHEAALQHRFCRVHPSPTRAGWRAVPCCCIRTRRLLNANMQPHA